MDTRTQIAALLKQLSEGRPEQLAKCLLMQLLRMRMEHEKGTRFYGLQIGKTFNPYSEILDKTWEA